MTSTDVPLAPKAPETTADRLRRLRAARGQQQQATLETNARAAAPIAPDDYAQGEKVAAPMGLPAQAGVAAVQHVPAGQDTAARLRRIREQRPHVAEWLADPGNMAVGQDDLGPLEKLGAAAARFGGDIAKAGSIGLRRQAVDAAFLMAAQGMLTPEEAEAAIRPHLLAMRAAQAGMSPDLGEQDLKVQQASAELNSTIDPLLREVGEFGHAVRGVGRLDDEGEQPGIRDDINRIALGYLKAGVAAVHTGRALGEQVESFVESPRYAATQVAEQAPNSALSVAGGLAGGAMGGAPGAVAGLFAGEYASEYGGFLDEQAQQQGVDLTAPGVLTAMLSDRELLERMSNRAHRKAAVTAGSDVAGTALLGMGVAERAFGQGKVPFIQRVIDVLTETAKATPGGMAVEGGSEAAGKLAATGEVDVAGAVQEALLSPLSEGAQILTVAGAQAPIAGTKAVAPSIGKLKAAVDLARARQDVETITATAEALGASKAFQRSPERVKAMVARAAGESGAGTVSVDLEAWNAAAKGAGLDPLQAAADTAPDGANRYREARRSGTLAIPTADFLAGVGQSPMLETIVEHSRVRAGGPTLAEAEEAMVEQTKVEAEQQAQRTLYQSKADALSDEDEQLAAEGKADEQALAALPEVPRETQPEIPAVSALTPDQLRAVATAVESVREGGAAVTPQAVVQAVGRALADSANSEKSSSESSAQRAATAGEGAGPSSTQVGEAVAEAAADPATFATALRVLAGTREREAITGRQAKRKERRTAIAGELSQIAAQQEAHRSAGDALEARLLEQAVTAGVSKRQAKIGALFLRSMLATLAERSGSPLADIAARLTGIRAATEQDIAEAAAAGVEKPQGATVPTGEQLAIALFEGKDATTLFHEGFHVGFALLSDLATRPGSDPQLAADVAAVLAKLGAPSVEALTRGQLEQFAQWGEQYLREGKAPSPELRRVFAIIQDWFVRAYRSIRGLGVPIDPELRAIFDRLLASDDQIAAAEYEAGTDAVLPDEIVAAMAPEAQTEYRAAVTEAHDEARSDLARQMLADVTKERRDAFNEAVDKEAARVQAAILDGPGGPALQAMQEGREPKLDREAAGNLYSKTVVKALDAAGVLTDVDGMAPDDARQVFGFATVDAMGLGLLEAAQAEAVARRRARAKVTAESPDLASQPEVRRLARKAVASDETAKKLQLELDALAAAAGIEADQRRGAQALLTPLDEIKTQVAAALARFPIRLLNPSAALANARREGHKAVKHALAKEYEAAAQAKNRQRYNQELARQAARMVEEAEKHARFAQKLAGDTQQANLNLAGQSYADEANAILDRFEFRKISEPEAQRREGLLNFLLKRTAEGRPISVPDYVLQEANRKDYRSLTLDQLRGVRETLQGIYHAATTKDELSDLQRKRSIKATGDEMAAQVASSKPARRVAPSGEKTIGEGLIDAAENYVAGGYKAAYDALIMDGGQEGGPVSRHLIRPVQLAAHDEATRNRKTAKAWAALHKRHLTPAELRTLHTRRAFAGVFKGLSLDDRLNIAGQWGAPQGRQRLSQQFTQAQLNAVLNSFTPEQLELIKDKWKLMDETFREAVEQQRRISGQSVEFVEHVPFTVTATDGSTVTMPGGYAKIGYSDERPWSKTVGKWAAETMQGVAGDSVSAAGALNLGFLKSREDEVTGKLRLDSALQYQHLMNMNHVLAFREAIRDADALLNHDGFHGAVQDHYGKAALNALKAWLQRQAAGNKGTMDGLSHLLARGRQNTVTARLAFRLVSGLKQHLGFKNTMVRMGPGGARYYWRGLSTWFGDMESITNVPKWAISKSTVLADRLDGSFMRELNELRQDVPSRLRNGVAEFGFWFLARNQFAQDLIAWLAMYERTMDEKPATVSPEEHEAEAIARADQFVRDAQGGGQSVDMSLFEGGNPLMRVFTTFYTEGALKFNLTRLAASRIKDPVTFARFLGDMFLLYWFVPVASALIQAAAGDDDDEPAELAEQAVRKGLAEALDAGPGFREFTGPIQKFEYRGPSGLGPVQEGSKWLQQVTQGEMDAAFWRSSAMTLGTVLNLPSQTVIDLADSIEQVLDGEAPTAAIGIRKRR